MTLSKQLLTMLASAIVGASIIFSISLVKMDQIYITTTTCQTNTLPSVLVDGDHKRQWISNFSNKHIPIPCPDNPKKSLDRQKAKLLRSMQK